VNSEVPTQKALHVAFAVVLLGLFGVLVTPNDAHASGSYAIGDTGPGGGVVFITPETTGNSTGKYFEARDPGVKRRGCQVDPAAGYVFTDPSPISGNAIGDGLQNSLGLAGQCPSGADRDAFEYATSISIGGLDDWFVPSTGEYQRLWAERSNGLADLIDYGGDGSLQFVWQSQIRGALPSDDLLLFNRGSGSTTGSTTTNSNQSFLVARMFEVTTPAAPTSLSATALDQGASISFTPG
jgi:hypothetical protein